MKARNNINARYALGSAMVAGGAAIAYSTGAETYETIKQINELYNSGDVGSFKENVKMAYMSAKSLITGTWSLLGTSAIGAGSQILSETPSKKTIEKKLDYPEE